MGDPEATVNDAPDDHPWVETADERFTLALVLDVGEVLARHGYVAPTGVTLVELTAWSSGPSRSTRLLGTAGLLTTLPVRTRSAVRP
jgi:hypothetical protein